MAFILSVFLLSRKGTHLFTLPFVEEAADWLSCSCATLKMAVCSTSPIRQERHHTTSTAVTRKAFSLRSLEHVRPTYCCLSSSYICFNLNTFFPNNLLKKLNPCEFPITDAGFNVILWSYVIQLIVIFFVLWSYDLYCVISPQDTCPPLRQTVTCWVMICTAVLLLISWVSPPCSPLSVWACMLSGAVASPSCSRN